jgi:RimJ/RimL family protein N-acetyltransferase
MSLKDFTHQVDTLWAAHFGCDPASFDREGTSLLPRDHLRGEGLIHIVYIRKHALAEFDPVLEAELRGALAASAPGTVLSSELLQRVWGVERIAEVEAGLIFHLRPGDLVRPELDWQFTLNRLTSDDESALNALRQRCTEYEIEDAYVEIGHEIAWGCFKALQLAAVGSGYRRNGFMDFGVLTDPDFRGQGLARHVVRALADDTLERRLIPQYRCNRVNKSSRRVAEAAGFTLYFTTESVKLKTA